MSVVIRISQEQWDDLGQRSFDARVARLIRDSHPSQAAAIGPDALASEITRQAVRARGHGLKDEHAVATYVYTAWLLGPDFDERVPALTQILREPTLSGAEKAKALADFSRTVFHVLGGGELVPRDGSAGVAR